ncbi:MAG: NAD(P)/FAD-dependent oxidoreductase [Burkholderiales bacterium]|nr:NAD(P)/FAD-dependent oxidoreductase [Burkholderiales bacterium]
MTRCDVLIIGAGAAGLFCAGVAAQRGLHVLLLDHFPKVAEKIRISGGGRSNFTNKDIDPRTPHTHFLGENPAFARSALSRYTAQDFMALVKKHGIGFHEKHKGQLFCDRSAQDLIDMLLRECDAGAMGGSVTRWQPCELKQLQFSDSTHGGYEAQTSQGAVSAQAVVVATGGLSIPKIGATDLGYRLAKQFGIRVVDTRPALVPLTFSADEWQPFVPMAGLSLPVSISTGHAKKATRFDEDLLFTHRGLSGPAVLQISSYWQAKSEIRLNLLPDLDMAQTLVSAKQSSKKNLANTLSAWLPARMADLWTARQPQWQRSLPDTPDKALSQLADSLQNWSLTPSGTEGYAKAEVTAGGVDTRDLSQQTMESKQPGLYFIGEVVDITGWLGGYNFQWAWASAHACAQALAARIKPL